MSVLRWSSINTCTFTALIEKKGEQSCLPDDTVSADNELRFGVPLVVSDVVVSLQPDPLLPFGQEAVITGFTLSKLHY